MNPAQKKFQRLAVLADIARETSEALNDEWNDEFGKSDAMINLAELEKSGIKLNNALAYRDYLWQIRQLLNQLEALGSNVLIGADTNFEMP